MRDIQRRERAYRNEMAAIPVAGKTVILVTDGLNALAPPLAAITAVRMQEPAILVLATPVACTDSCQGLADLVDEFVCLELIAPLSTWTTFIKTSLM